ncbi:MAG TPA: GNAT family N-acetyltransferase [Tenuifilaceae bacterium]|nr:GNAT family N-acetyltransferase [Tenuifilaceae bacterium]HOZ15349.1 GNAT family N-acetyltransferase [Tenuifilaceae bacterium]HPI46420.1 GNAT family N-acetyltransferase [Tenuifilaceae bacterium]HPN21741.1 GNAT family N-acetyltransferase [Tenuifilaceae bacterium]
MNDIEIRPSELRDLNIVYELICDLEDTKLDFEAFKSIYNANIRNAEILYLIAEYNETVVGFLSIHVQRILHHSKPTCELQELNVFSEYRSMGIGTALMQEAERIAKELGLEEIELTTKVFRKRAQEFYFRLGYQNTHLKFVKKLS